MRNPPVTERRAEVRLGPFSVTWLDLWTGRYGLAFAWRDHSVEAGFGGPLQYIVRNRRRR